MIQTVMKLQRQIKELQRKNEALIGAVTFFKEEYERLTVENIHLLMEIETLKERIKNPKGGKKKKTNSPTPQPSKKKKKRGRKPGSKGTSRKVPDHVDEVIDLTLDACPHCGSPFEKSYGKRVRYKEDIPMVKPHVIKYIIHQYYCPHCKRSASETPDDIIPHCRLGINVMLLTVFQKYGLHLSYDNIRKNLELYFGMKITTATLCNAVRLISHYYKEEFDDIKSQIKEAKAVYTDETGWRIKGVSHWLWTFVTKNAALFKIDKRRSSDVPKEVLGEDFEGVFISDFYSAYHTKLPYKKQKCLVHLLRDTRNISQNNAETKKFHKQIKRFVHDAARFKEKNSPPEEIAKAKKRFQRRLLKIITGPYTDADCIRLAKRLTQHFGSLLTFLEEDCDFHNNRAENALRSSVIARKISFGNNSRRGADNHEILMTIFTTCTLQNKNFLKESTQFMKRQLRQAATSQN